MTAFWWAVIFGGFLMVAAVVISVACLRVFAIENAREDAQLRALRNPGMGDLSTVTEEPEWARGLR